MCMCVVYKKIRFDTFRVKKITIMDKYEKWTKTQGIS